ncbi:hypothetical protein [Kribbella koreensis]
MNEQEMFLRVGEWAGRIGYPMPTINWVEGVIGEDCIRLQENSHGVATLTVHDHVNEFSTEEEQELVIVQGLVQARLGPARGRRRLKVAMTVLGGVVGIVAILLAGRFVENYWLSLLLALACAYVVMVPVQVLMNFFWCRWMSRRADTAFVEAVGRERVVAWLTLHAAHRPARFRARIRWVLLGAPPLAAERLRMLGEKVVTG